MTDYATPHAQRIPVDRAPTENSNGALTLPPPARGNVRLCAFFGRSMQPTLQEGDVIEVQAIGAGRVRRGDIVWAMPPEAAAPVIHRVSSITPQGIRTRGDNCPAVDPWTLARNQLGGRVQAAWRGSQRIPVRNGPAGRAQAAGRRFLRAALRPCAAGLRPWYRRMVLAGTVRRLLPQALRPRLVTFQSEKGAFERFLVGQRAVGWRDRVTGQWRLRFPYALLIDPSRIREPERRPAPGRGRPALPIEADLVVRACASVFRPEAAAGLSEAAAGADWNRVLRRVSEHCVVPLFFRGIRSHAWDAVPERIRTDLRTETLRSRARNLRLCAELAAVCGHLQAAGVRAAPIKGPVLSVQAYGDPALRVSWDIDLLIDPQDARRARPALESAGYTQRTNVPTPFRDAHFRQTGECTFEHPQRRFQVELAFDVVPRCVCAHPDYARLWQTLERLQLDDNVSVPCLSPEEHFVLCCRHATKHAWERLIWIMDAAALLRRADVDWSGMARRAAQTGQQNMILLAAQLAQRLAGIDLPPALSVGRRNARVSRAAEESLRALRRQTIPARTRKEYLRFHLAVRERFRDRVRHVVRLALTPSYADWTARPLPRRLRALYFAIRPLRLLSEACCGRKL